MLDVQVCIDFVGEFPESGQARRIGNAGAAEKDHATVLMLLQQAIRDVGAILDELHGTSH